MYSYSYTLYVFYFFSAARVAFGVEVILGAFIRGTKRPLKELHVLDAGKYAIYIFFFNFAQSVAGLLL